MKLTKPQKEILSHPARFKVVVSGRRFGKTYASIASLAKHASVPNTKVMYCSPSYRMSKQICWEDLKSMLREKNWIKKINESELTITLVNSSIIMLRSLDNPDSIRGLGLDHVVIDEAADVSNLTEAWNAVIRPTLSDRQGSALIISSPKGRGYLYDLYQNEKRLDDWKSWQYTTIEGGNVSAEEIEAAKRDLDEKTFKQEYLAQWIDYSGLIYYAFGQHNIVSRPDLLTDRGTIIHVGIDFNFSPLCAVIAVKTQWGLHVIDEIGLHGSDTQEMCAEIQRKYGNRRAIAYPDASGAQHRSSAIGGITDHIILSNAGFQLKVGSINPAVKDRLANVNAVLKESNTRLTIEPSCAKVIQGLQKHVYLEGTRQPDKHSGLDHFNDALGYMVNHLFPTDVKPLTNHNVGTGQKARRSF
tara:strand:+ start:2875 stop:4119 length:1245 start_codon:yes stop_codon:yes gene_type:complete